MNDLYQVKPGVTFMKKDLQQILGDAESNPDLLLFFAMVFELNGEELGRLARGFMPNVDLVQALTEGSHSLDLQDYLVQAGFEDLLTEERVHLVEQPPPGEFLPQLWGAIRVEVATSVRDVAQRLGKVVQQMPGRQGHMLFKSMMVMNARRPVLGDFKAFVQHDHTPDNLVILDVSGSMRESTIEQIVGDVVALSFMAKAHLAIVSDTATVWGPGEFDVQHVLARAEYSGTHYETLFPLMERDWGTVITIADYDSSWSAKEALAKAGGSIELVLDISLVNRPTFLSECVGQRAAEVRSVLVAADNYCCMD